MNRSRLRRIEWQHKQKNPSNVLIERKKDFFSSSIALKNRRGNIENLKEKTTLKGNIINYLSPYAIRQVTRFFNGRVLSPPAFPSSCCRP